MYDQTKSVELSNILNVVQKPVEFSGVGALARCSQYKISHVHDVLRDYTIAEVGGL